MWSLISFIVAGIGLFADHMSDKEERERQEIEKMSQEMEIVNLRNRIEAMEKEGKAHENR